jgi:hypothetical protein
MKDEFFCAFVDSTKRNKNFWDHVAIANQVSKQTPPVAPLKPSA